MATAALTGDHTIEIWGDGEQTRSFTYIDDCLEGTLRLTASDVSEPLNIGSDQLVTINQLVDIVEGIAGVTLERRYKLDAPQGVRGRNSDNTLIRERWAGSRRSASRTASRPPTPGSTTRWRPSSREAEGVCSWVNRRRALVMADQGVSSLSNVVVSIIAARSLSAVGFGAFAVATVGYLIAVGSAARSSGRPSCRPTRLPTAVSAARWCPTWSVPASSSRSWRPWSWGRPVAVGGACGSALVALAVVLPLMLVQDTWRYAFIVDRPAGALAVDLVWLVAVCAVLPLAPDDAGPGWFVVAWGLDRRTGALAGLVLTARAFVVPHPVRWLATHRQMGSRFIGELVTGQAVSQLVLVGVGAMSGLSVLGGVRAAQVYYGPLNTLHLGIYLALVPEGARGGQPRRLRRLMARATVVLVGVAAVWMVVGLALPDAWGLALFQDTWTEAGDLMLPIGLATIAGARRPVRSPACGRSATRPRASAPASRRFRPARAAAGRRRSGGRGRVRRGPRPRQRRRCASGGRRSAGAGRRQARASVRPSHCSAVGASTVTDVTTPAGAVP